MEHNTTQLKKFTPETMKEIVYVTWPTLAPAGDKDIQTEDRFKVFGDK